jgi:hypothetical protein
MEFEPKTLLVNIRWDLDLAASHFPAATLTTLKGAVSDCLGVTQNRPVATKETSDNRALSFYSLSLSLSLSLRVVRLSGQS